MPEFSKKTKLKFEGKYSHLAPFLEGIAHESRNPMQGIMASLGVLRTRLEGDSASMPFVEMIQKETVRITELIDQLLWLTRKIQPDHQRHDLAKLVTETVRNMEQNIKAKGASITVILLEKLPPLQMDSQALTIALSALLENALESRKEGVIVQVEISGTYNAQRVRIQDNGDGISPEDLPKILEPFFSTKPKRTGLGLCLADHVIDAHYGIIGVQSTKGQGTEVTVEFPVIE